MSEVKDEVETSLCSSTTAGVNGCIRGAKYRINNQTIDSSQCDPLLSLSATSRNNLSIEECLPREL